VDTLSIVIVADSSLMSESQVQEFADLFETEFQELEQLEPTAKSGQLQSKKNKKVLSLV